MLCGERDYFVLQSEGGWAVRSSAGEHGGFGTLHEALAAAVADAQRVAGSGCDTRVILRAAGRPDRIVWERGGGPVALG